MNRFLLVLTAASVTMDGCSNRTDRVAATENKTRGPLLVSFTDLKWAEYPGRDGMLFAVLSGDPRKGAFTEIRKVPAGTDKGLHSHSSELRDVVISGIVYTGPDAAGARNFGPGSVIVMPANWIHVSGCRAGSDCVFYQEGKGKFDYHRATEADSAPPQDVAAE
jgi:hypothetical protein